MRSRSVPSKEEPGERCSPPFNDPSPFLARDKISPSLTPFFLFLLSPLEMDSTCAGVQVFVI